MNDTRVALVPEKTLGDTSPSFPIALGERLRLVDDPLQWIVERQQSETRWRQVRFHRDRDALLIWLKHSRVLPEAIATVAAFPRWHPKPG
jgi:hypothetical protein